MCVPLHGGRNGLKYGPGSCTHACHGTRTSATNAIDLELEPTADLEPEPMPVMESKPAATSVLKPNPAAKSDQVCEPVPMCVQIEIQVELDCTEEYSNNITNP